MGVEGLSDGTDEYCVWPAEKRKAFKELGE